LIDVHCHIDAYDDPVQTAASANSAGIFTVAVTNTPTAFEQLYPHTRGLGHVHLALGLHPLSSLSENDLRRFELLLDTTSYVGEVGLDYSRHGIATRHRQEVVFRCVASLLAHSPHFVTMHSRQADAAVLDCLEEAGTGRVVFHWYSGSLGNLERLLAAGHMCSVNPDMVASVQGRGIIEALPKERVLTETDGPFTRIAARPTTPADVSVVVNHLATLWQQPAEGVVAQLQANLRAANRSGRHMSE
jgi:TatD DNase family protein